MQAEKKAIELISRKYSSRIVALHESKDDLRQSILDNKNGTLFSMYNSQYTFRDIDGNIWLSVSKSILINDKMYYPVAGDRYTFDKRIIYFVTKENLIEMAIDYFEKFIDPYYGLELSWKLNLFCEDINGQKHNYQLVESKFKSCAHKEISAYISFN